MCVSPEPNTYLFKRIYLKDSPECRRAKKEFTRGLDIGEKLVAEF
jgi:hypothetical protein